MTHLSVLLGACGIALAGGAVASLLPVPLPWMTGALVATALLARFGATTLPPDFKFPQALRDCAVAAIGVTIGAQVTPELLSQLPSLALTTAALLPFVLLLLAGNYLIFRRLGDYPPPLAYYAGAPGGLIEAITLGEAAGADPQRLIAQQFLRLILVLIAIPAILSVWLGVPVGSAAGLGFGTGTAATLSDLAAFAVLAALGLWLRRVLKIPAGQITGPLLVSALAAVTILPGLTTATWLLNLAQVGVGASLGLQFLGIDGPALRRAVGLAVVSCTFMTAVGITLALTLAPLSPLDPLALIAAYAPGGVTEMSLVALTLGAAPAAVTLHHLLRIVLTVLILPPLARRLGITANDKGDAEASP
ncbi:AbrB family transcriptional regulator [Pseudaestuariivita atlantica]|uniref:Aminopeptidase n=1 Tax=Pseudaestuariivita atlantica TaxID=1317121 RepID=A0A0L1JU77_9RHOB|nr:AbrB family transcriptional regulator [Pseudaestuariivita atlantica]KNG95310.1 hypothetical protein ATO11_01385 [Pseudaestuariivita atlantica]